MKHLHFVDLGVEGLQGGGSLGNNMFLRLSDYDCLGSEFNFLWETHHSPWPTGFVSKGARAGEQVGHCEARGYNITYIVSECQSTEVG